MIIDDIAWIWLVLSVSRNSPGIIAKVDESGALIESFYSPFYIDTYAYQNYVFSVINFYVFSDLSFITVAKWFYYQGDFGISEYSFSDFCYFKVDSNRNFKWSASIDFTNNYEENQSMFEYNNTLYVAIVSSKYYYWLQTLDLEIGTFQHTQWVFISKKSDYLKSRSLIISYVSDKFVYAYGESNSDPNVDVFISIFLFNQTTFKLARILHPESWNDYYGFKNIQLNSDEIYWISKAILYRFSVNETSIYGQISYMFDNEFINNSYMGFRMKETSYEKYIMSVVHLPIFNEIFTGRSNVFTIGLDSNFNTNSWLSLSLTSPTEELISIPIGNNSSSGEPIYLADIVPNTYTTNTSSLYMNSSIAYGYYFVDISEWVWPRFVPELNNCHFPLPTFMLSKTYNIQIGI